MLKLKIIIRIKFIINVFFRELKIFLQKKNHKGKNNNNSCHNFY
jgi:hypothetical protein